MIFRYLWVFVIAFMLSACIPGPTVQSPSGKYIGLDRGVIDTYLGIPYAMPPVNQLRWRAPLTRPSHGKTPYYAIVQQPGCLQGVGFTGVFYTSEDCLYLNIWKPKKAKLAPVMVYIHGGSGDIGAGTEIQYDGRQLASLYNVIVVTINARLGIMGFLSLPDLTDEGFDNDGVFHSGNYNYLDQLKALEWVNKNIASFGGDPNNVTLFGESAGGISTCLHLSSPMSANSGYFHKAIIQSGNCEFKTRTQAQSDAQGQTFAESIIGCPPDDFFNSTLNCMRSKSGAEIYARVEAANPDGNALSFTPILPLTAVDDNYFIDGGASGTTHESMITHSNSAIPIIIGHNRNEGTLLHAFSVPKVQTTADYNKHLVDTYDAPGVSGDSATLKTLYPASAYPIAIDALSDLDGDKIFVCTGRRTADAFQEKGHAVYYYELQQPVDAFLRSFVTTFNKGLGPNLGVFHSSDIPFVFGMNSVLGDAQKADTRPTMSMMMQYWTSFARNGVPTSATAASLGLAAWPSYVSPINGGTRDYVKLKSVAPSVGSQRKQAKCDYWQANIDTNFFDAY
jgi:para-nitrobenzyl esterase